MEVVDPKLGSDINEDEAMVMINVAILCTNISPSVRPTMSSVVSMLEGRKVVKDPVSDRTDSVNVQMKLIGRMDDWQDNQEAKMTDSLVKSMSIDGLWTESSTSVSDLYPINKDSGYWEKRD